MNIRHALLEDIQQLESRASGIVIDGSTGVVREK